MIRNIISFKEKGGNGFDTGMLELYLLLYADDLAIFAESSEGLQNGLNIWQSTVVEINSKYG